MKSITKLLVAITLLLSYTTSNAQKGNMSIKNATTTTVHIYGNCGMCKKNIETAGDLKKVAAVDWDKTSKMAVLTYNPKKTNPDQILKRIALAGYDSEEYLAPDNAYDNLMGCCQYDRTARVAAKTEMNKKGAVEEPSHNSTTASMNEHAGHKMPMEKKAEEHAGLKIPTEATKQVDQMQKVFNSYFEVKDALVNTDASSAATKGAELVSSLKAIKMNELAMDIHMVWMKVMKELESDAQNIASSKKIEDQRKALISLTKNIYALMKLAKAATPTYYQFCPMANGGKGANWLSKENEVKNPYYGSMMMSCGSTVETIK